MSSIPPNLPDLPSGITLPSPATCEPPQHILRIALPIILSSSSRASESVRDVTTDLISLGPKYSMENRELISVMFGALDLLYKIGTIKTFVDEYAPEVIENLPLYALHLSKRAVAMEGFESFIVEKILGEQSIPKDEHIEEYKQLYQEWHRLYSAEKSAALVQFALTRFGSYREIKDPLNALEWNRRVEKAISEHLYSLLIGILEEGNPALLTIPNKKKAIVLLSACGDQNERVWTLLRSLSDFDRVEALAQAVLSTAKLHPPLEWLQGLLSSERMFPKRFNGHAAILNKMIEMDWIKEGCSILAKEFHRDWSSQRCEHLLMSAFKLKRTTFFSLLIDAVHQKLDGGAVLSLFRALAKELKHPSNSQYEHSEKAMFCLFMKRAKMRIPLAVWKQELDGICDREGDLKTFCSAYGPFDRTRINACFQSLLLKRAFLLLADLMRMEGSSWIDQDLLRQAYVAAHSIPDLKIQSQILSLSLLLMRDPSEKEIIDLVFLSSFSTGLRVVLNHPLVQSRLLSSESSANRFFADPRFQTVKGAALGEVLLSLNPRVILSSPFKQLLSAPEQCTISEEAVLTYLKAAKLSHPWRMNVMNALFQTPAVQRIPTAELVQIGHFWVAKERLAMIWFDDCREALSSLLRLLETRPMPPKLAWECYDISLRGFESSNPVSEFWKNRAAEVFSREVGRVPLDQVSCSFVFLAAIDDMSRIEEFYLCFGDYLSEETLNEARTETKEEAIQEWIDSLLNLDRASKRLRRK